MKLNLPKLRLYQQIIITFLVVVSVPLLGVSFIIYNVNQTALKKEMSRFTRHTAEAIFKDLNTEMRWQQQELNAAAHLLGKAPKQRPDQRKALANQFFDWSEDMEAVGFYDAQGKLLDEVYRDYFKLSPDARLPGSLGETILNSKESQVFDVVFPDTADAKDNIYSLRMMVPCNASGTTLSSGPVCIIQRKFPYLAELIRSHSKTLYDGMFIIDNQGTIVAGESRQQRINPDEYEHFQKLKPGVVYDYMSREQTVNNQQNNTDDDEDNRPLQKVIVKIPNIQWGVLIESPYHMRQHYIKRAKNQTLLLIAASLILIMGLGIFYAYGISRNFRQLIKGIKAMGEGNYARRIRLLTNWVTPFEIVFLVLEFNRMGRKIAEAWQKSQDLTLELMDRNREEAFVNQVTKSLHGTVQLADIGPTAVEAIGRYFQSAVVVLAVLEHNAQNHRLWVWQSGNHPELDESAWSSGPMASQPLNEVFSDWSIAQHDWLSAYGLKSQFLVPIQYQENQLGYLALLCADTNEGEKAGSSQREDNWHTLTVISDQLGVAVHQAHQWEIIQDANEKLAKLDELKSNLIDTVSHELRTPLTSIKGYTSRLIRYDANLDTETRQKSLKVIKGQADRLSRMVDDLLVIPDLETSNLRVFPDSIELRPVIERAIQCVLEKETFELDIRGLEQADVFVLADPDRLEQVLVNLLDNAAKYSSHEAPIELIINANATNAIEVAVTNVSEPIEDDVLQTLFQKFKRLDERLTRTTRGSGLGLFITKGLVEAMGGSITLSWQDGRFIARVSVPLVEAPIEAQPA